MGVSFKVITLIRESLYKKDDVHLTQAVALLGWKLSLALYSFALQSRNCPALIYDTFLGPLQRERTLEQS